MNFDSLEKPQTLETIEKLNFSVGTAILRAEKEGHPIIEDAIFAIKEKGAFGVFDGVSRGPKESVGSIAAHTASDYIEARLKVLEIEGLTPDQVAKELVEIMWSAHGKILQMGEQDEEILGMATTASIVQVCQEPDGKKKAVIANVGDSRVYILRANGKLEQATIDDSEINFFLGNRGKNVNEIAEIQQKFSNVATQEDVNNLSEEERGLWNQRKAIISNALGKIDADVAKIYIVEVEQGDTLFLTTDGIENLTDKQLGDILNGEGDNQSKAEKIMHASRAETGNPKRQKGMDDIGIVLATIQ